MTLAAIIWLLLSLYIYVCQRNHYGTQAFSSILELAFLLATSCLMCSVQHKCICVYGDNCFLARKTSLSSDQVLGYSPLSLSYSLIHSSSFLCLLSLWWFIFLFLSAGGQMNEQLNGKRLVLLLLSLSIYIYIIVVHLTICISLD